MLITHKINVLYILKLLITNVEKLAILNIAVKNNCVHYHPLLT